MKKIISVLVILLIVSVLVITTMTCKQPQPPKAIVFVVDEVGTPVVGAQVVVKPQPADAGRQTIVYLESGDKHIADTQWTNDEGKIYYDFRYKAIYRVEVTKDVDRNHPYVRRALGTILLENDKTFECRLTINEQTTF
jgi:hypothetical protein